MTDFLVAGSVHVLESTKRELVILETEKPKLVILEKATQGPPGPPGPPGPVGNADGAFLVDNRLSELASDPTAQAEAQANLGLGTTDPLAYYILAKA